ncbi:MAG: ZIP family metal transporter [Bacteroidia bacterium]|nr:ZIP family metal transporter [Bacteroidia bacterium]
MKEYLLPFLAVIISFLLMIMIKGIRDRSFKLLLAFSGAFLLALTVFELLPDVYPIDSPKVLGICILAGILLQIILEFFSRGAEHGHMHFKITGTFPWVVFISLSLHALMEGIPIASGDTILFGIVIHKIPIALILSAFILQSEISIGKAVLFMSAFALMTPIGTYLTTVIPAFETYQIYLKAIVVGMFLHISTVILFESSEGHTFNFRKMIAIIVGLILAYFI